MICSRVAATPLCTALGTFFRLIGNDRRRSNLAASHGGSEGHQENEDCNSRIIYAVAAASGHDQLGHPECAARIPAIQAALEAAELSEVARPQQLTNLSEYRPATFGEVTAIHRSSYIHTH